MALLAALVVMPPLLMWADDRKLFPVEGQERIFRGIRSTIDAETVVLSSDFGHDGFLIETAAVGAHLRRLLES